MIHLSNQRPKAQHLPILEGAINLHQVLDLVKETETVEEIALEYMAEYKPLCMRDLEHVEKYMEE